MRAPFWSLFIPDRIVNAICWTLIHSLWIGLVIALLCGIVIAATRKAAAVIRYRLLCSLLVLFVCAIGVTYYLEVGPLPPPPPVLSTAVVNFQPDTVINQVAVPQHQTLLGSLQAFLNRNITVIFLVWLLFFMLKSLKMVSGLLYIQRIRNYKTHAVTEELKHKIEHFSSQIGIRRAVRLVQSELVKVPVALGWLKPMILLPVGIAFQLTPEQLEGILWHELAHIRRRDYLVNILQGLLETVFFFNPGLLWLSSLIRTEREACCDDMVLSRMHCKANYLEALLSFGYGEFKNTGLAMGIGSGNQLRDRLKRMISQENKRLGVIEKVALATGLIALSAFTSLPKTTLHAGEQLLNKIGKPAHKTTSKDAVIEAAKQSAGIYLTTDVKMNDTPHGKIDSLVHFSSNSYKKGDYPAVIVTDIRAEDIHGKKYHLTLADNKLVGMEINGKKINNSDLPEYQYMVGLFREKEKADSVVLADKLKAGELAPGASADKTDTPLYFINDEWVSDIADTHYVRAKDAAGTMYSFTITKNKLVGVSINGNNVPQSDVQKYVALLRRVPAPPQPVPPPDASSDKADTLRIVPTSTYSNRRRNGDTTIIYNVQALDNHGRHYSYVAADYKLLSMSIDGKKIKDSDLPKYDYVVRSVRESDAASLRAAIESNKKQAAQNQKLMQQLAEQNQRTVRQVLNKPQQPQEPTPPPAPPSLDKMIADVTNDLINEHIIKDKSSLSTFKLTNTQLVVNGVKQPDDIQRKLRIKYLTNPQYPVNSRFASEPNFGLYYNARTHGVALGTFNLDLNAL